jgi:hypothetical protein
MVRISRVLVVLSVCLAALWPEIAWAQADAPAEERDQVVLAGDLVIPKGHVVGEVVVFHGSVLVQGVARGDVVVLDGSITVSGQVSGAVVALDGDIKLLPTAQVSGDVMGGGRINLVEGTQVRGTVRQNVRFTLARPLAALGVLGTAFAMSASTLLLGLLLLLIAPRGADRVSTASRTAPFASLGWGFALTILIPVAAVAAAASILGLPLGLASLLALGFVFLVGYAWSVWCVGRAIAREPRARPVAFLVGWAVALVIGLVPLLNVVVWIVGSVFGLGAMAVAVWRSRGQGRHRIGGVVIPEALPAPAEQTT